MQRKIRLILADDHTLFREGLAHLLRQSGKVEVVGAVSNGEEAVEMAFIKKPDVVIMDVAMPVMNGLEATAKIKEKLPQSKIVILSMYEKQQYIDEALQNGASGYVLKDTAGAELIKAIDYINGGGTYLSPLIASKLTKQYINLRSRKDVSTKVSRLTDRETEVLKLLALGKTNKEISEELYISVKTVETHRKNMMSKLELRNLADVVRFALKEGIISL